MKPGILSLLSATVFWIGIPVIPAFGTYDAFLKIGDIEGEAQDQEHAGWIEVHSFSWGMSRPGSSGDRTSGLPEFVDLSLAKPLDKASPEIFLAGASGRHIEEVFLVLRSTGETRHTFFEVRLSDVIVTASGVEGSAEDDRPTETLSLNYGKIEWTYTPQNPNGSSGEPVQAGWDIAANTKI